MSTNRTKTDWAYKKAQKIQQTVIDLVLYAPHGVWSTSTRRNENVRQIAGVLRRVSRSAYRSGYEFGCRMGSGDQRS